MSVVKLLSAVAKPIMMRLSSEAGSNKAEDAIMNHKASLHGSGSGMLETEVPDSHSNHTDGDGEEDQSKAGDGRTSYSDELFSTLASHEEVWPRLTAEALQKLEEEQEGLEILQQQQEEQEEQLHYQQSSQQQQRSSSSYSPRPRSLTPRQQQQQQQLESPAWATASEYKANGQRNHNGAESKPAMVGFALTRENLLLFNTLQELDQVLDDREKDMLMKQLSFKNSDAGLTPQLTEMNLRLHSLLFE